MYFSKIFGFCIILHLSFCQEETVFHCSAKPGCQISECDPLPSRWSQPGFNMVKILNRHEFPITCKSEKIQKSDNGFLISLMQGNVQDIRTMRSKMDKLEEKIKQSSKKVEDTPDLSTKKASELQESQEQLKNEIKELKRVTQNFQERLSLLVKTDGNTKKELTELKISNQNLKNDVVQLTKANENMEQKIKELENDLSTLGKTDKIRKQEVEALEKKLKKAEESRQQDMQELKIQMKELLQSVESTTESTEQGGDEGAATALPTETAGVKSKPGGDEGAATALPTETAGVKSKPDGDEGAATALPTETTGVKSKPVECYTTKDKGASYRGFISETINGRTCQRWDSQSPHEHTRTTSRFSAAGLESNYCRNPDEGEKPWCYTTDPDSRWEYCAIQACSDGDEEATTGLSTGTTDVRGKPDNCDFKYKSKCFQAIIFSTKNISFADAQKICNDMGWHLANVYDVTHYRKLKNYLRLKILFSRKGSIIWTGMTYKNKILRLRAGEQLSPSSIVWQTGFPYLSKFYSKVALSIHKDKEFKNQGIENDPSHWENHGALCEL